MRLLTGQISVKRLTGKINIIPGQTGVALQAREFNTNGVKVPDEDYVGFNEALVNVFVDFNNLPTVDSIEKPVPGSPVAVMYDGAVYVLCEGEYKNG